MKELFERHYKAIRERGLITDKTMSFQFLDKIAEELEELEKEYNEGESKMKNNQRMQEEAMDIICTCVNWLIHSGCDIQSLLRCNVETQENRAKHGK